MKYKSLSFNEQKVLKDIYPDLENQYIAKFFGTSVKAIEGYARRFHLHKSREHLREIRRKNAEKTNEKRWGYSRQ